jgi:hypothetical protein
LVEEEGDPIQVKEAEATPEVKTVVVEAVHGMLVLFAV